MKKLLTLLAILTACISLSLSASAAIPASAKTYNGHAYKVYNKSMTWTEAKAYCEKLGGHLVTITTENEQNFVDSLVASKGMNLYWMGLYRQYVGASWQWITGESYDYNNWATGEPNNDNNKQELYCGVFAIRYTGATGNVKEIGTWNDMTNTGAHYDSAGAFYNLNNIGFVCEWETTATSIKNAKVTLSKTTYTYNGKSRTPRVTVKLNSKKLTQGEDYTVTYISNKYPGVGYAEITGIGDYTGTVKKYFKINPKKVTGLSVKKSGSKRFTATWNSMDNITGYQLQYTTAFSGKKTVKIGSNLTTKTIKKLSTGRYSVRIRAYATTNGKTAYGAWSTIKTVKVTK